jgi:hypothetical protein
MSLKPTEKIKSFLKLVIAGDLSLIDSPACGLCFNLDRYVGRFFNSYNFIEINCIDWEHFSGEALFPVPCKFCKFDCSNKWVGKQLELRQSLCKHLLTKLE